jgi:antitoxin (DNA-binding transcriptional repressor) of toxin-antitoxin stability system
LRVGEPALVLPVTRDGTQVAEIVPLRRTARNTAELIAARRTLPKLDHQRLRADLDAILDPDL